MMVFRCDRCGKKVSPGGVTPLRVGPDVVDLCQDCYQELRDFLQLGKPHKTYREKIDIRPEIGVPDYTEGAIGVDFCTTDETVS